MDKKIYQYSLKCLTRREHSVYELQQKLKERFLNHEEIELVIQELQKKKLLNDERFADAYVRMRSARGYGPLRIRQELQIRGISFELIDEFVNHNDEIFLSQIKKIQHKRSGRNLSKDKLQQMRYLNYRGFTTSQIKLVLDNDDE